MKRRCLEAQRNVSGLRPKSVPGGGPTWICKETAQTLPNVGCWRRAGIFDLRIDGAHPGSALILDYSLMRPAASLSGACWAWGISHSALPGPPCLCGSEEKVAQLKRRKSRTARRSRGGGVEAEAEAGERKGRHEGGPEGGWEGAPKPHSFAGILPLRPLCKAVLWQPQVLSVLGALPGHG